MTGPWPARALVGVLVVCAAGSVARAEDEDEDYSVTAALRSTLVVARLPDDPVLFPETDEATSLWRFRLMATARPTDALRLEGAYEHRIALPPDTSLTGFGILPSQAAAPYRITQLDWELGSGKTYVWRHEIDRLAASYKVSSVDLTVGRQAIGWGRGTLFSAIDLFSPFSPLEIDREWRRGVDAARAEVSFTPQLSADAVAAAGDSIDSSAFVGRVRGYRGTVDFELVGGWRARDLVAGATTSLVLGDAELHGELAFFRAPDPLPAGGQLTSRTAIKAVAGGSYRIDVGNGILVLGEYHYSGFGAADARDLIALLSNPQFVARFTRGDTQIVARQAVGVLASYEVSPELSLGLRWLQSPVDGSGIAAPIATATLSDRMLLIGAIYVPWGATPSGMTLESFYGSTGVTGYVQLQASY